MRERCYWDRGGTRCKLSQISKAMRMTLFMAVVLVTQLSAKVNGQNTAVNLTLKNVSVEEALSRVEKQLDVNFFFNRENVDLEREVSVELKDAGIDRSAVRRGIQVPHGGEFGGGVAGGAAGYSTTTGGRVAHYGNGEG